MNVNNVIRGSVFTIILLMLTACVSIPKVEERSDTANQLAAHFGWQSYIITTDSFNLMSYQARQFSPESILTIYIEGDGFAWRTRSIPSMDPTPINPVGLQLALNHPGGSNAVYLARPCQYVGGANAIACDKNDWTTGRFSEEVIAMSNQAVTALKAKFGASQLQLIGYSGGGAVAALIAARRSDVIRLISIAGNLDHQAWTKEKHLSPLTGSLNPVDYWRELTPIEQIHFIGGNDPIMGSFVAQSYQRHFNGEGRIQIITLPDFDHHCCWAEQWGTLSLPYLMYNDYHEK
ncbi:MAG: alpha/beta hydrolase [Methylophaga sp.]|nr:MAG: alpha/beta hydrolase [Methylophaga sp.]